MRYILLNMAVEIHNIFQNKTKNSHAGKSEFKPSHHMVNLIAKYYRIILKHHMKNMNRVIQKLQDGIYLLALTHRNLCE